MPAFNEMLRARLNQLELMGQPRGNNPNGPFVNDPPRPMSIDELTRIERSLGITLPEDYRGVLLMVGGGLFLNTIVTPVTGTQIGWLCGTENEPNDRLSECIAMYRGRVPESMIPIASNLYSDLFCLGIKGEDYGKIFFWDHNMEAEVVSWSRAVDNRTYRDNVTFVAESFTAFVNTLKKDDD